MQNIFCFWPQSVFFLSGVALNTMLHVEGFLVDPQPKTTCKTWVWVERIYFRASRGVPFNLKS